MSEVESQSPATDATTLDDATTATFDTSSQADSDTQAEHEVDSTEQNHSTPLEDTPTDLASSAAEANGHSTAEPAPPTDDLTVNDITPSAEESKKEPMASPEKARVPVPIKTTGGAAAAGPKTPLVRKVSRVSCICRGVSLA